MTEVVRLGREKRIRYLEGDEEIFPGVRVLLLGGHTPGSQAVVVDTRIGTVVLAVDLVDLYRNLEEEVASPMIDLVQGLLSWDRIKKTASTPELIIPGHDPLIMKKFPNPAEGIVEIG